LPLAQVPEDGVSTLVNGQHWVIRSTADAKSLETAFRNELRSIDPDVATANVRIMESYLSESIAPRRFNLRLLTIFSIAALLLAATGVYGLISYSVSQRTPEIGIRLALGASRQNIFRIVLGQGLRLVVIGLVLGFVGALALTRLIRGLMFGITPSDPLTFITVSLILIAFSLLAACLPALRATKLDPLRALRSE
jgi:ABC-type antimicrobial peptide transport system permease subunit